MAKLTKKMLISYLMIVFLMAALGIGAMISLSHVNENGHTLYEDCLIPLSEVAEIAKYAENTRVQMVTAVNFQDEEPTKIAEENIAHIENVIAQYEKTDMPTYEKETFLAFKENWNAFIEVVANNISLVRSGDFVQANDGIAKAGVHFNKASDNLKDLVAINKEIAQDLINANQSEFETTRLILILLIAIAVLLAIGIGVYQGRAITTPIKKISDRAHQIAAGDLTGEDIVIKNKDEIGELAASFNGMTSNLKNVVATVVESSEELSAVSEEMAASSEQVSAASVEVSKSMNDVAENTEVGNESVVDVSKVLLELSSLIQIAKQKATSALNTSNTTQKTANDGKEIVNESIGKMEAIRDRTMETEAHIQTLEKYSQEIGHITQMITSIADQTNLLALNASIEAARAGEHGLGFAVVAEEVRKLAEQSNDGASQVAELVRKISGSTSEVVGAIQLNKEEVDEGVQIVASAGDALDRILMDVAETLKEVTSITDVTDEEVASSEKIVSLIGELSKVMEKTAASTQEVASATEETTAAMENVTGSAEEVSAKAEELQTAVHIFKL